MRTNLISIFSILTFVHLCSISILFANDSFFEAPVDSRKMTEGIIFKEQPVLNRENDLITISFEVNKYTDVEIAVVNKDGAVICHLAAGLLGKNPPAPLQSNSLKQKILWDGKDDQGKKVDLKSHQIRVQAGSKPQFISFLAHNSNHISNKIVGLGVTEKRELMVITSENTRGRSEVLFLSQEGKYIRTLLPYSSKLSKSKKKGFGSLDDGGKEIPVVFNAHGANLAPLTSGFKRESMMWHPEGFMVFASAAGTIAEHGPHKYILHLDPEGGVPEKYGFVGTKIREPVGFIYGTGEANVLSYDGLTVSPDGKYIYQCGFSENNKLNEKSESHGVYRFKMTDSDKGEPFLGAVKSGNDDHHFNTPAGLSVDKEGNIYVCDVVNQRLMVYSQDGKLLQKVAVKNPEQISVHRKTGDIFILCRPKKVPAKVKDEVLSSIVKYSPLSKGKIEEVGRLDAKLSKYYNYPSHELMTLDDFGDESILWVSYYMGWRKPNQLRPIKVVGNDFVEGENVIELKEGLGHPSHIALDGARNRLFVADHNQLEEVDLKTGKSKKFLKPQLLNVVEPFVDTKGNLWIACGWDLSIHRFDAEGNPLAFESLKGQKLPHVLRKIQGQYSEGGKKWDAKAAGVNWGSRGHVVDAKGNLYVLKTRMNGHDSPGVLDVYDFDGNVKKIALVSKTIGGSAGIGVDAGGNLYMYSNIRSKDGNVFPKEFTGQIPETGWRYWKEEREGVWKYPYYNPYLFHWGALLKFGASGGELYNTTQTESNLKLYSEFSKEAPSHAKVFTTGYRDRDIQVEGIQWRYNCAGHVPEGTQSWGDPSCTCHTSRFGFDGYGRTFTSNVFRFGIDMIDSNGNFIQRIGRYGNVDEVSQHESDIPFAWPGYISYHNQKIAVSDEANRRIVYFEITYQANSLLAVE